MKETVRNSWMTYPLLNTRDCSEFTGLLESGGVSYDGKITSWYEALNEVLQMDSKEYDDMVERSIEYIKKEINLEELVQKYINAFNLIINTVRR
ncbi:hypothetical protein JM64_01670 [Fervidobacterium ngatamarikiense]|uniref:Uncharacterized protein n=1 Tax=Fervidobacterium pennivorans TaxID=93466 RepID=A0A172T1M5_FERPE|nr:hypothetical protein JM64_01670 [Fervidobacterium pennivorans]